MEFPPHSLLTVACADLDRRGPEKGSCTQCNESARNERGIKSGSVPNDGLQVSWGSSFDPTLQEINPSIIRGKKGMVLFVSWPCLSATVHEMWEEWKGWQLAPQLTEVSGRRLASGFKESVDVVGGCSVRLQ